MKYFQINIPIWERATGKAETSGMVRETETTVIGEKYIEVMTCMIEETLESMVKVCMRMHCFGHTLY